MAAVGMDDGGIGGTGEREAILAIQRIASNSTLRGTQLCELSLPGAGGCFELASIMLPLSWRRPLAKLAQTGPPK